MIKPEEKFKTSCEKCMFAQSEDGVQSGCSFNRIEAFRKNGKLTETGPDSKFYIINTICNASRDSGWGEKYENPMSQVLEEIKPKIHTFIIDKSKDSKSDVLERVMTTLKDLLESEIRPQDIHLVLQNPSMTNEFIEIFNEAKKLFPVKFSITYELERELDMVDASIGLVAQPYYMVVKAGEKIDPKYLTYLNNAINKDMYPVVMTDRVYLTGLHRSLGGNRIDTYKHEDGDTIVLSSLREKVMILVNEQKNPGAVLNF